MSLKYINILEDVCVLKVKFKVTKVTFGPFISVLDNISEYVYVTIKVWMTDIAI